MEKKKYCKFCKKLMDMSKHSSSSLRSDGYCTAKCKRKDRNEYYKDLDRLRVCDPDTGWF